jgi:hypothetical protein
MRFWGLLRYPNCKAVSLFVITSRAVFAGVLDSVRWRVQQAVYTHYDRLLNYYYLCQKLARKERAGGKVRKTYDRPMSPYDRVVTDPGAPEALKLCLRSLKKKTNLMVEMKHMQQAIDKLPSLAEPVPVFVVKQGMKPLLFGSLG